MAIKTAAAAKAESVSQLGDAGLRQRAILKARELGATIVGIAPVGRWDDEGVVPANYRPRAIWSNARSVIVFGVPMLLPVIETTPSINYQEHYDTSNRLLDEISFRLATWLTSEGCAAISLPRDGYS